MNPSVSVVLLNYNHARFLPESLGAILAQSRQPDELIVIDDGSTDESVRVIESLLPRAPYVTFLRNETNRGVLATARRGWETATGDYLYFAAADDRVLPGFFEKSMRALATHPHAGVCSSYASSLDDATGRVTKNPTGWCDAPRYFSPTELARVFAEKGGAIPGHAAILKRSAFLEAGTLLPELKWHCDWFNSRVIAFRHGICHIPESLALLRLMPTSYSASGTRDGAARAEVYEHMARLLTSDAYRDVLPLFCASGILLRFGTAFLPLLRQQGVSWEHIIARLPLSDLRSFLHHTEPGIGEQALQRLAANVPHLSPPDLAPLLSHPDPDVRARSAFRMRAFDQFNATSLPLLLEACTDPDEYVRLAAAYSADTFVWGRLRRGRRALISTLCARICERIVSRAPRRRISDRALRWLAARLAGWVERRLIAAGHVPKPPLPSGRL